jgi:hypothetical protein
MGNNAEEQARAAWLRAEAAWLERQAERAQDTVEQTALLSKAALYRLCADGGISPWTLI